MDASLFGSRLKETSFDGTNSSLGSVGDIKLGEDVLDVNFDRAHTHHQGSGYLPVGPTLCQQLQHFELAWCQLHGEWFFSV